jgi:hypothetical protein
MSLSASNLDGEILPASCRFLSCRNIGRDSGGYVGGLSATPMNCRTASTPRYRFKADGWKCVIRAISLALSRSKRENLFCPLLGLRSVSDAPMSRRGLSPLCDNHADIHSQFKILPLLVRRLRRTCRAGTRIGIGGRGLASLVCVRGVRRWSGSGSRGKNSRRCLHVAHRHLPKCFTSFRWQSLHDSGKTLREVCGDVGGGRCGARERKDIGF